MKALVAIFALALTASAVEASSGDLGLFAGYYHDCPASRTARAKQLRAVIGRALRGEHDAMRSVIMHDGIFFTGDNEGYSEVPEALLRTLGDVRYAAFVAGQSAEVRNAALALLPAHTQDFARTYPRTAKLYQAWIASQRHRSEQMLRPNAGRPDAPIFFETV